MYIDMTVYNRDDKEKKPKILRNETSGIIFQIVRHSCYKDEWFLSCLELNVAKFPLDTHDVDKAKTKAIDEMKKIFAERIKTYEKAIKKISS